MKNLICFLLILSVFACKPAQNTHKVSDNLKPVLLFNTGFEDETRISSNYEGSEHFTGIDHSVPEPNDWSIFNSQNANSIFNSFRVNFGGGNRDVRKAEIVSDPVNPANRVLHFRVNDANSGPKGRIQAEFIVRKDKGIRKLYQKVKVYVPESMRVLENCPDRFWIIIAEFWNNMAWTNILPEYAFRVSVHIQKDEGAGNNLCFMVTTNDIPYEGEGKDRKYKHNYIESIVSPVQVPYGTWMTVEYYFQEGAYEATGDLPEGHFFMAVMPEGGERKVVCSLKTITHSPSNPNPDGLTDWAAMKLYFPANLVKWIKEQGLALELYYDDLEIWQNKLPPDLSL